MSEVEFRTSALEGLHPSCSCRLNPQARRGQEGATDWATDEATNDCSNSQSNEVFGRTDGSPIEREVDGEAESCDSTAPDKPTTNGCSRTEVSFFRLVAGEGRHHRVVSVIQATLAGSFCPFGSRVSLRLEVAIGRRMAASQQLFTRPLIGSIARPQRQMRTFGIPAWSGPVSRTDCVGLVGRVVAVASDASGHRRTGTPPKRRTRAPLGGTRRHRRGTWNEVEHDAD